jgi:hypothetical protein
MSKRCSALIHGALLLAMTTLAARAGEGGYGALPAGWTSVSEISDVSAEICRDHLFDPTAVVGQLPAGFRLVTAAESAQEDPALGRFLQANPRYSGHALGSLCFLSVRKFLVDGERVQSPGRIAMAFWWARVVGTGDARMRGKAQWVQLASWYPRDVADQARILATDPTAAFTDLRVEEITTGNWRVHLALPEEVIDADIQCSGDLVPRRTSAENFMSVPMAGKGKGNFWVITYFGHQHRPARGEWRSQGKGIFSAAWAIPGEADSFATLFQSRWSALSGLYER